MIESKRSGEGGEKRENRTRKTGSAIMQLKGSDVGNFFFTALDTESAR
jgi:hypothetical protein